MESDGAAAAGPSPTPDDARKALGALAADRAALADRLWTPWWYHPVLGVITAAFVASPAMPTTSARSTLVTFGCVGLVLLMLAYRRVTGFSVSQAAGPRSRARMLVVLGAVALLFVASMMLAATGNGPWALAAAAVTFLLVVVGGRRYDHLYREELRAGG